MSLTVEEQTKLFTAFESSMESLVILMEDSFDTFWDVNNTILRGTLKHIPVKFYIFKNEWECIQFLIEPMKSNSYEIYH